MYCSSSHPPAYPTHHGGAAGEGQHPGDQGLQLLDEGRRRLQEDGLQAAQRGQLHPLVWARQRLQQQGQQLDGPVLQF